MRFLVLTCCAAISLAGCGPKESADQNAAAVQNLTAESISSNDTTSIDAASGADANMAEDVQLTVDTMEDLNAIGSNDVVTNAAP